MKIRILIPQCGEFEGYYCKSATQIDKRINLLRESIKRDFDLLVTSHNFFTFYPNREESVENFIKRELTPKLNELDDKIPIILGFDLLTPNIRFNPFSTGIDALVIALNVKNNKYIYGTHIWECWENKNNCNNKCFENQNPKSVIRIKGRSIGILSCGDIAMYCHKSGNLLPISDIYVDLSHKSLRGWTSQNRIPKKMINNLKKCKYVIVTQQVKNSRKYLKDNKYPYIFPQNIKQNITEIKINDQRKGVLVDINL